MVDFKIPLDEIHSFGIRFLESIMSKTSLSTESFPLKLIVAVVAGIIVGFFIGDVESAFVDLKFESGFRAKPPKTNAK